MRDACAKADEFGFPPLVYRCPAPKFSPHQGRDWVDCETVLPDGTLSTSKVDIRWGRWFYLLHGTEWRKGELSLYATKAPDGRSYRIDLRPKERRQSTDG